MATPQVDQSHVDRLTREIVQADRVTPSFARALIAAVVARLGPAILKPAPRDDVDITALVG